MSENFQQNSERRQELLLLGQIHGLVQSLKDGQDLQNRRMDRMEQRMEEHYSGLDSRLREVEKKAAVAGALSGGAVAVGTALVVEGIRQFMNGGLGN
ncbi:hypothetical protein ACF8PL_25120 [Delftia sp. WSY_4]|jgi:hypothetical protein|uniref:hypothetical protein n=1 Tax=Delftia TaxID=80865 RepID=UPI00062D71E0|nr:MULTISPECIES: hypothetical protein [Delftia]OJX21911.1 MAG: hypothetical protein BGO79_27370 [Delftia sp. 67-8]MDH0420774.1 hypothetical protein [Delftia tsuruhatensis]QFS64374.1 hypothetical protein GCS91_08630 [Delftia tsuruhatensis]WAT84910.1 hypothetical protein O1V13_26295 [Delftia acidovorans]WON91729.1 hypothetical protein OK021_14095 [Delftia sp. UGAL515B_04]